MSRRPLLTFALASLLGIIVVSTLLIAFIGSVTRRDLHQEFHARNELLAKSMTSSLERDGLVQILETPEELSGSTLAEHPLIRSFDALVAGYINGLPILHVRFYNTHSRVVYSTNKDVIGDDGSRDVHLSTAMRGRGTSRLIRRSSFNPIAASTIHHCFR